MLPGQVQMGEVVGEAALPIIHRAAVKPPRSPIGWECGMNRGTKDIPGQASIHTMIALRLEREREGEVESDQGQMTVFTSPDVL